MGGPVDQEEPRQAPIKLAPHELFSQPPSLDELGKRENDLCLLPVSYTEEELKDVGSSCTLNLEKSHI